jgi:undecaprenyl-diphosphatase
MDYFVSAIYGIVQGVTEFLPVSSSGHLVLLHRFLTIPFPDEVLFDVTLHLSTLIALIIFFWKDILKILKSWLMSFRGKKDEHSALGWMIIIGTIPAALAGALFENLIENSLRSPLIVAAMLVLVGVFFIILEKRSKQSKTLKDISIKQSLAIGAFEALALIPGVSRSGITIIAGLGVNLKRSEAVRFSFLLSIPIIAGAAVKKIPLLLSGNTTGDEAALLAIAFVSALISGFFAIKYFLKYVEKYNLNVFAYYRFALALFIILYMFL